MRAFQLKTPELIEILATICFGLAVLHTFLVKRFRHLARKYPGGSTAENFFHLLGEVEVVFGVWSAIYLALFILVEGATPTLEYLQSRDFTEPAFVFVIMAVCATRPILGLANHFIEACSKLLPWKKSISFFVTTLILGPMLGSFITEPAAMTVTALILLDRFYKRSIPLKLKYAILGLLFVNISIGGTLTPYAAPPVLMVASKWDWGLMFMLQNFGWKGVLASTISTAFVGFRFRKELSAVEWNTPKHSDREKIPLWIYAIHFAFLIGIVAAAHYMVVFIGTFLFFLGFLNVTREYQENVKLKEGLMVAFFLGGLVILGGPQRWWLEPLLANLSVLPLYLGAITLTAVTDNAALTYLGSQVPTLSEISKYALVAGSVVGGGLTVIANAPNPSGYGILNHAFGKEGISPLRLLLSAMIPTLVAGVCFWFL